MRLSTTIQIRQAIISDAAALTALCRKTFQVAYAAYNSAENMQAYLESHFTETIISGEIQDPSTKIFLCEGEDQLAGYLMLKIGNPPLEIAPGRYIEIARFYVDAAFQGRQLGRALMEEGFKWSVNAGFESMWLGVWKENTRAIAIYQHLEFTIAGETTFILGDDVQYDHVMIKKL